MGTLWLIVYFFFAKTPNEKSVVFNVFVVLLRAPDRYLVVVVLPVIQVFQQLAELIFCLLVFEGFGGWAVVPEFLYL